MNVYCRLFYVPVHNSALRRVLRRSSASAVAPDCLASGEWALSISDGYQYIALRPEYQTRWETKTGTADWEFAKLPEGGLIP